MMWRANARAWSLVACLVIGVLPAALVAFGEGADPPGASSQTLQVASGGGNVWVVTTDPAVVGRWRLLHHNQAMDGPYARVSRMLSSRPVAIAARDDQVLVAMNPENPSGSGIDLLGLRIEQDPTMGSFYELPLDSWNVLANIPSDQPFKGLALGPEGPLVLLGPSPKATKGVKRTSTTGAPTDSTGGARLLEQRAFAWHELPLPDDLLRNDRLQLLPSAGTARASVLASDSSGIAVLHQLVDDQWDHFSLGIKFSEINRTCQTKRRLAFSTDSPQASTLGLSVLRGKALLEVGSVERPAQAWGLGAVGEDLLIIASWAPGDEAHIGSVLVNRIDVVTGTAEAPVRWARLPLDVAEWLQLPLIGLFMVTALLAIMLFRPTEDLDLPLKMGVVPMPMGRRLLALGLDLLPGIVIALLVFRSGQFRLDALTLWTSEFAFSPPGALIIGVTLLHETLAELLWGRSLGKMVCGGVVRSSAGGPASSGSILLRAVFKGVVLCAPILGVFAFLSPARQGIPETVSRTVVAERLIQRNLSDSE